jgi:hypothetical protein
LRSKLFAGAALAAPILALALFAGSGAAQQTVGETLRAPALDADNPWYPLPDGDGVMEVYYACNACHSLRTVTNVRYSRRVWDELLDWMVEVQGMPEFRDDVERQLVLDYLATNLSPESDS